MTRNSRTWLLILLALVVPGPTRSEAEARPRGPAVPVEVLRGSASVQANVAQGSPFPNEFDQGTCEDLAGCLASASATQTLEGRTGTATSTASSKISTEGGSLLASGQGSIGVGASRPPEDEGNSVTARGTASYFLDFTTTRPFQLEFVSSLSVPLRSLENGAAASVDIRRVDEVTTVLLDTLALGALLPDGSLTGSTSFSGEVPAGRFQLRINVAFMARACRSADCEIPDGTGGFSFTLTLGESAPVIRWVSAAGGSWDDAANWDPERVPGSDDTAVFDLAASYAVSFPPPAASAARAARGAETCASTRPVEATIIRDGTVSYSGAVDLSTLADSPDQPGLRVGGTQLPDEAKLVLLEGELCSIFATLGEGGSGSGEVEILGGQWKNEARLQVGDAGPGRLVVGLGVVEAAEVRVGGRAGGAIVIGPVESAFVNLSAGALLVGSELLRDDGSASATVEVLDASMTSGPALIGLASGVCLDQETRPPCARDADCTGGGSCSSTQQVRVADGSVWLARGDVFVGGGLVVDDSGTERGASGNGALIVETGGHATTDILRVGVDDFELGPDDSPDILSQGTVVVRGSGSELNALDLIIGQGGVGRLVIEDGGRAATRPGGLGGTAVPFLGGRGSIRIAGSDAEGAASLLQTQLLLIDKAGEVVLDRGRITADDRVRVRGTLRGIGTVFTPEIRVEGGTISGGILPILRARAASAPAGLTIEGDLVLQAGATLQVAAAGPGECSSVHVTGDAALGGTLEMVFLDGYAPGAADACGLLSAEGVTTGSFERIVVRGVGEGFTYAATPGPGGTLGFEVLTAAAPCAAGDLDGDGVADCERCDNCVDDNDNGLVDREDPDCVPAADGGGLGLADAEEGRDLLRCHAALRGATKQLASQTWKQHQKCADAMLRCHQRKPDDPRCVEKVAAKCAKASARLSGAKGPAAKAEAKIAKACAALPIGALREVAGLGHEAAEAACAAVGVPALDGSESVATCASRRELCQLGELLGAVIPRSGELLGDAGIAGALPCLAPGSDGKGDGLGDPRGTGKRAGVCQKALGKAAGKLLSRALDAGGRCEGAVLACLQTRPGDASCLANAEAACAREEEKLAAAEDKLLATIEKKCGEKSGQPLVALDDLLASAGLGFAGTAARCSALGIPELDSRDAVAACLVAEHHCREGQIREAATPRSRELLGLGGAP